MRKYVVFAAVAVLCFSTQAAVSLNDRVLTISESGKLSEILAGDYAAYYTALKTNDGTITNVILEGVSQITVILADDLEYTGAWSLKKAIAKIGVSTTADPTWPFGKGTGSDATIRLSMTGSASTSSQILVDANCVNATISAPIHIADSGTISSDAIRMNGAPSVNSWLRLNGLVTLDCSTGFYFQGNGAKLTMYGGMEASGMTVKTTGANGNWYVYDNPISLGRINHNYVYLRLYATGNAIDEFYGRGGGRIVLYSDGALSGADMLLSNFGGSEQLDINGHDATVRVEADSTAGTVGSGFYTGSTTPAVLTVSNDVDVVFNCGMSGRMNLLKKGTGKLTVDKSDGFSGELTVADGTMMLGPSAALHGVTKVNLTGGRLEFAAADAFADSVEFHVADREAEDQILLPQGGVVTAVRFSDGSSFLSAGTYGSAASSADTKLGFFDGASDGVLRVFAGGTGVLEIVVPSGSASIANVVSSADLAKLNNNEYTLVEKTGSGTLLLDKALDYAGAWFLNEGGVHVLTNECAFGKGQDDQSWILLRHDLGAYIEFYATNIVVSNPIKVMAPANANPYTAAIRLKANTESCTLRGRLSCPKGRLALFHPTKCAFYTRGGVDLTDGGFVNAGAGQKWWICDVPADISKITLANEAICFAATGNKVGMITYSSSSTVYIEADDAFIGRPQICFTYNTDVQTKWGVFDLKGHDTAFDFASTNVYGYLLTSSTGPATLDFGVTGVVATNNSLNFGGKLSLRKTGSGEFVFKCSPTCAGSFEVAGGTVVFADGVVFANCTNAVVRGDGARIVLNESDSFDAKAELRIADGGKVNIVGPSTVVHADLLFFDDADDVSAKNGTWGSTSSSAQFTDDSRFEGAGVLFVSRRVGGGTLMLLK